MYKYLFGPVPSRRLGQSLGVDLVTHKICSFDCLYCECGKTTNLTMQRKEYVPYDDVITELDHFWQNNLDPDYITFSGSGEPTLNISIGKVIDYIKEQKPEIKIAVLTNGSLLFDKEVRNELSNADLVIPSLDAVSKKAYLKMNRPSSKLLLDQYIKGIQDFSKEYKGRLFLEIFILSNINDSKEDLELLKNIINSINPELVQLNSLDRPGTIEGLKSASYEELKEIEEFLGFDNIAIIAAKTGNQKESQKKNFSNKDITSAIIETIQRRPCTAQDLEKITGADIEKVNNCLASLLKSGTIESKQQKRGLFYQTVK